jgi:hypothetical protein
VESKRGSWIIGGSIVLGALLPASCASDPASPVAAATPAPSPSTDGPRPRPPRFETLEAAAEAIGCPDVRDVGTGGNPGLRAFGVCNIGRDNIDIYLTSQRSLWENIAEQVPSVLGPGWIIVTPTGEKAARHVQSLVGGELRGPGI